MARLVRRGGHPFGGDSANCLAAAVEYLTPLPAFWTDGYEREDIERSLACFPFVGLLLGLLAGLFTWLFGWVLPPLALAALAVVFLLKAGGGQGAIGLAALGNAIFKAPLRDKIGQPLATGALSGGAFLAVGVLIAKVALLGSLSPWQCARGVVLMAVAGRAAMVLVATLSDSSAKEGAVERVLWEGRSQEGLLIALVVWGVTAVALLWAVGLFAFVGTVAYAVIFSRYCRGKFGGVDGQSLFAAGEACELITVLILAIGR